MVAEKGHSKEYVSKPSISKIDVFKVYISKNHDFQNSAHSYRSIIGASLSEPHIDKLNVHNLYIIIIIIMVRTSTARRCRECTGVRDIFQHDLEAA